MLEKQYKKFLDKEFVYLHPIYKGYKPVKGMHELLNKAEKTDFTINEHRHLNIWLIWQLTMSSQDENECIVRKPGTYMIKLLSELLKQLSSPEIQSNESISAEDELNAQIEINDFISQIR